MPLFCFLTDKPQEIVGLKSLDIIWIFRRSGNKRSEQVTSALVNQQIRIETTGLCSLVDVIECCGRERPVSKRGYEKAVPINWQSKIHTPCYLSRQRRSVLFSQGYCASYGGCSYCY